ncbi:MULTISPECIES: DUF378 domain-containing protein [Clostridium]|jgi:uncharacterized membrane protein YuzA (DUF378 family)|uniref:DUF378 domain-containing protein n=1 Tax=Clostridium manihotivorum TaxID=2320868 RepID=A0A3R5QWE6_9CLOT|nr:MULTISPECIES: DUF378 domain-containing protein [Clostridium]QAA33856.1 DUF378 domain-containing protein [Clostridium manihotivorum]
MKTLDIIALVLVIIGAINWGLIGFFRFDLVAALFGDMSAISRVIYAIVGIAGLYAISFFAKDRYTNNAE